MKKLEKTFLHYKLRGKTCRWYIMYIVVTYRNQCIIVNKLVSCQYILSVMLSNISIRVTYDEKKIYRPICQGKSF